MVDIPSSVLIPDDIISNKIYLIRNLKVILDCDLAELYQVTTGNLNKSVKRNQIMRIFTKIRTLFNDTQSLKLEIEHIK